jgi:redox-sensitive bicupin YhaK (pirin superfamily)
VKRLIGVSRVEEGHWVGDGEPSGDASVLLLGGLPIGEPVVGQGPFVMTTAEEIRQAMIEYRNGRIGRL